MILSALLPSGAGYNRLLLSVVVVAAALVAGSLAGTVLARRAHDDPPQRYWARKLSRYASAIVAVIGVALIWRGFAGRAGEVLGLMAAGIAFAMQEVVGALAGWVNIVSGRVFRVGDRIEMGGVRGDVIDITPLRTKIMEMGSPQKGDSWVRGWQYTGRVVAVSNKATFTDPVFNYSVGFNFVWEELTMPISYDADWELAERIMREEAVRASASETARSTIDEMARRYPVPRTEVEPRVFVRATSNYLELAARFAVPLRTSRSATDAMTRRIVTRLSEAGIRIASSSQDITLFHPPGSQATASEQVTASEQFDRRSGDESERA